MKQKRDRSQTRNDLLDAADRVVRRDGASTLTLDAAAREAGLSKGGVLYHFPTKNALIGAMIERICDRFEREIEAHLDILPESPGRWTRAYLDAAFDEDSWNDDLESAGNAGLLAAIAASPAMLDPLRERYTRWQSRIEVDGIDPAIGTLIRMTVDGLWMADLLGLEPPDTATRILLRKHLIDLIERGKETAP